MKTTAPGTPALQQLESKEANSSTNIGHSRVSSKQQQRKQDYDGMLAIAGMLATIGTPETASLQQRCKSGGLKKCRLHL
jgi:hypothetical protein